MITAVSLFLAPYLAPVIAWWSGGTVIKSIFEFFKTPVGQIVLAAIVCFAIWIAGDLHGHRKEKAECDARTAAMQAKVNKADENISSRASELAAKQTAALQKEAADAKKKISDLEKRTTGCRVSPRGMR